jgi:nucleoside-diphosphate-sugar epimerase
LRVGAGVINAGNAVAVAAARDDDKWLEGPGLQEMSNVTNHNPAKVHTRGSSRKPQDDPKQRQPDITKARKILRWEPKVPLAAGLKQTIANFRDKV